MARIRTAPPGHRGTKTWVQKDKVMNYELARDSFVQTELGFLAQTVELRARNRLAQHMDEGQARIVREEAPNGIDQLVILEDLDDNPDAMAIEFGHWTRAPKEFQERGWGRSSYVEGLYILGAEVGADPWRGKGRR